MRRSLSTGKVVDEITNPAFEVPTTVGIFGNAVYVVNAQFGTAPPTDYAVIRADRT